jgi:hypothetical protein
VLRILASNWGHLKVLQTNKTAISANRVLLGWMAIAAGTALMMGGLLTFFASL